MNRAHPSGRYRYLPGGDPYSSGVAAEPGFRIVRAVFTSLVPWRDGFGRIESHLDDVGVPKTALCAIELRCPGPYSIEGFNAYNETYCAVLRSWNIFDRDANPVARTNVAPRNDPPSDQAMYAFSYTVESKEETGSFVVSGGGEVTSADLVRDAILRVGETSEDAVGEKARYVMDIMNKRVTGLGFTWDDVRETNVYTVHPIDRGVVPELLGRMGRSSIHGIRHTPSAPPVEEIEFEMDLRCVAKEIRLG